MYFRNCCRFLKDLFYVLIESCCCDLLYCFAIFLSYFKSFLLPLSPSQVNVYTFWPKGVRFINFLLDFIKGSCFDPSFLRLLCSFNNPISSLNRALASRNDFFRIYCCVKHSSYKKHYLNFNIFGVFSAQDGREVEKRPSRGWSWRTRNSCLARSKGKSSFIVVHQLFLFEFSE